MGKFKMKGTELYGKLSLNRNMDNTSKPGSSGFQQSDTEGDKSARELAAEKAYRSKMNTSGEGDSSAGDYQDENLDTALGGESVDRGPGSEWMEGRHGGKDTSYDAAMAARQRYLDMTDEEFETMEAKSAAASARSAEKKATRKAEGDARQAAIDAKNEAGYNRMSNRQQKKFREANPQYFL